MFNNSFIFIAKNLAKMVYTHVFKRFGFLLGISLLACLYAVNAVAQSAAHKLTIQITNVKSSQGKLMIAVFNKGDGFPGITKNAVDKKAVAATKGTTQVIFENLPTGTYAIAIFHDENGDGKLNSNLMGIPKEDYGFSNNARSAFSAPTFQEAAFVHKQVQTISIKVK